MKEAGLVLETSAVVAYAEGYSSVGMVIAETIDRDLDVIIPAACLAEAYQRTCAENSAYLDILAEIGGVTVTPVERDMCSVLGGWTRILETMGVAQAAMEAAARPIVPIMTDQGYLIHRILPKEWPIIEP